MNNKERIDLYLSGQADTATERDTENVLLFDNKLFENFIEAIEQRIVSAPLGFVDAVMALIPDNCEPSVRVTPFLSRKLCAIACFCSAAVIMLATLSGLDRLFAQFISEQHGKVNQLITFIENINFGGK